MSTRSKTLLLGVVAALLLQTAAFAQASDALFRDFAPYGDLAMSLDGKAMPNAEIYLAEKAGAYLITAAELKSPLLINVRARRIESVSFLKMKKKADGTIDLLADAAFDVVGPFQVSGQALTFSLTDGRKIKLEPKPSLLGTQTAESLIGHNRAYGFKADQYQPKADSLSRLKAEKRDVTLKIYFGSWCPVCSRLVPKVIKVAEALEGSPMQFEYYGLPQPMSDDPITEELGLHGVPTGILYVGDKEVGRLSGRELNNPEMSIAAMLGGA